MHPATPENSKGKAGYDDGLSCWVLHKPMSRPGRVRNADGKPVTGFVTRETKKTRKVSVAFNGNYCRHYSFPVGVIAPKHPMVSWLNVPMCGIPLIDADGKSMVDDAAILGAVMAGRKPVGDIWFYKNDVNKIAEFTAKSKKAGLEVIKYSSDKVENICWIMVGVNKPISELFDLAEISNFYSKGTGSALHYFADSLENLAELTPARALQSYEWSSPQTPFQLVVTGMCLGYAFESTLAIILEHFRAVPGGWCEK